MAATAVISSGGTSDTQGSALLRSACCGQISSTGGLRDGHGGEPSEPGPATRWSWWTALLASLVHLRHGVTHDVLACWFRADRSTITRAICEIRPLPAERGCAVGSGVRLHTAR